jgi:uncharacterized protein (DUF58 family)
MVASSRLYWLLASIAVVFAVGYAVPWFTQIGIYANLWLLAVFLLDVVLTPSPKLISGTRAVFERLSIGRKNEVRLEIFNNGSKALKLRVRDDYPFALESDTNEFAFNVPGKGRALLNYNLTPRRRGQYEFENINVAYASTLGLFWRRLKIPAKRSVKVFSDLVALKDLSIHLSQSSELGEMRTRKRGHGTEFSSLREYVSGDDTRKIDWKATARRERPVVRVYEVEQEQTLMVLVDAGRMMVSDLEGLTRFDHALNAALALALTGLHKNDQVGFGIFADRPLLFMPPRRGKSYLSSIVEAVCAVEPRTVEPDYAGALSFFASAQKSRSLMVVLTDLTDVTASQTLLSGMASLSPRHLPFCVTLRDRQIDRVAQETSIKELEIYRRAVATDLMVQRQLAFSQLQRRGCMVLDCPPQELSEKLVDRYLEIKARGRL